MKHRIVLSITVFFFALVSITALGQKKLYDLSVLLQEKKLTVINRQISAANDHLSVKLEAGEKEGIAWSSGVSFSQGTIEIDLKGKDVLQQSFLGIAFHAENDSTYDAVYFRPFNFLAKDPVRKIHAVQYISHPVYGWKKLRDEYNGIYEKGLVSPPDPNGWFHARIVVQGELVTVFVNNDKVPSLTIEKLNKRRDGKIGLWVGDGSDGEFKNISINHF